VESIYDDKFIETAKVQQASSLNIKLVEFPVYWSDVANKLIIMHATKHSGLKHTPKATIMGFFKMKAKEYAARGITDYTFLLFDAEKCRDCDFMLMEGETEMKYQNWIIRWGIEIKPT
jgi:hypothetical protein